MAGTSGSTAYVQKTDVGTSGNDGASSKTFDGLNGEFYINGTKIVVIVNIELLKNDPTYEIKYTHTYDFDQAETQLVITVKLNRLTGNDFTDYLYKYTYEGTLRQSPNSTNRAVSNISTKAQITAGYTANANFRTPEIFNHLSFGFGIGANEYNNTNANTRPMVYRGLYIGNIVISTTVVNPLTGMPVARKIYDTQSTTPQSLITDNITALGLSGWFYHVAPNTNDYKVMYETTDPEYNTVPDHVKEHNYYVSLPTVANQISTAIGGNAETTASTTWKWYTREWNTETEKWVYVEYQSTFQKTYDTAYYKTKDKVFATDYEGQYKELYLFVTFNTNTAGQKPTVIIPVHVTAFMG
jgi:hypothetical protein